MAISEFAKENLLRTVGKLNLQVHAVHLGTDPNKWYKINEEKFKTFTYLTVNTSNERSGFEYLIPAFIEFSKDKDVRLIIKDGPHNPNFANYINRLNNPKIKYSCELLPESDLRRLYCKSHVFVYANNTTSFGMNIMDAAMCGTPVIATLGSAIKEFLPEWTQPSKIVSIKHKFDSSIFQKFNEYYINYASDILQSHPQGVEGEIVDQKSILSSLEYSYANYKSLEEINVSHRKFILENYTWRHTAEKMISILKNYYE
jgi:glycosyltransferase involved in cell wall biosynthesis